MLFEESFIFLPRRFPEGDWQPQGIDFEDAYFRSRDGTKLHGWYVPHESPRAVVLFCNGQQGNLTWQTPFLERLHNDVEVSLFTFDYRGYGRSEGKPTERGLFEDVRAAREWLSQRASVSAERIVVLGASLGGSIAVDLAAEEGARALVLLSTFTSVVDIAARRFPYLPVRLLLRTRLDSLSKIGRYHGPLFLCHGRMDDVIPFSMGERLFAAAGEPKQFVEIPGWGHDTPPPDLFYDRLREFLVQLE